MTDLIPFAYGEHEVRTVIRDGEVWWLATDVAKVLNVANSRQMIENLEDDERGVSEVYTLGGKQETLIISEAGLYRVLMRSNKPEAKPFQRWVTHDVLPSIRRTGKYDIAQRGQETDWQTRSKFVTAADVHEENWKVVERLSQIYPIFKDAMSESTKREIGDFVTKVTMGGAKADPDLEKQITGENVIIIRSYLAQRGVSQRSIKQYAGIFGTHVHQLYKAEYGREAPTKQKTMGAASRSGKLYVEKDRFIIDRAFDDFVKLGYFKENK